MIQVKCNIDTVMSLDVMEPFQGDLKKRTAKDIRDMQRSLLKEGLLTPFVIWQHDGVNHLLDGHGRRQALLELAELYPDITTQQFPYLVVNADTEEDAKQALLEITSSYGKITKKGAISFTKGISTPITAPSVVKFTSTAAPVPKTAVQATHTVIKIKVPIDKEQIVKETLKSINYITVI